MDISLHAIEVIDKNIKEGRSFVVEFFAPWCGPCKAYAPMLHRICAEKKIQLYTVNGDIDDKNVEAVMNRYKVSAFPTTIIFVRGKAPHVIIGAKIDEVRKLVG